MNKVSRNATIAVAGIMIVLVGFNLRSTQRNWSNAQMVNSGVVQGPQGIQGTPGATGSAGAQGAAGTAGATGATGAAGTNGTNGAPGLSPLTATTAPIGGALLIVGGCSTGTVTVTGASVGMVAVSNPTTYPGDGSMWRAYISSSNTVTVKVCAIVALTPTASTYNVRVIQ